MRAYVATVHLVITGCETEAEAQDAVSACLTENLEMSGAIKDWAYARYPRKSRKTVLEPVELRKDYQEGDFLRAIAPK